MAVSPSVTELCLYFISSAFQRCRVSEDICRLSVILKSSPASDSRSSKIRISISDTGIGSSLEEFQNVKNRMEAISTEIWDGLLSVTTTSISDDEVYHYLLNIKETICSRRLTRLPSNPKNGIKFSGTEVCLSISESLDVLASQISCFFHKILILKVPNVVIELVAEHEDVPRSRSEQVFLANDSNSLPFSISNIERLISGLEDYVLKHGSMLNQTCNTCFQTRENLMVGSGTASNLESRRSSRHVLMMEVVIIMSELDPTCSSYGECSSKTEVLYFEDFKPCPISESVLNALTGIDWKSYGLTLVNSVDQGGNLILSKNLQEHTRMAMVLHCYHKQEKIPSSARPMTRANRNLIKRAVKLALDDLKEKHAGIFSSENAIKVRSYAPDLAKSIAGLVLSSNDPNFQEECFSLLGLQSREIREGTVEERIKEKIISVIDANDIKSHRSKDVAAAPLLFEDECFWNSNFEDEEFEEGEDAFSFLD